MTDPSNQTQLDRIEAMLVAFTGRMATVEADQRWLKGLAKWGTTALLAVIGKLVHITFFTKP